ncbi:MAG: hypothetical protein ACHBN1_32315 [Heteroscytonema crispum UTEX LB 1556]
MGRLSVPSFFAFPQTPTTNWQFQGTPLSHHALLGMIRASAIAHHLAMYPVTAPKDSDRASGS